MARPGAQRSAPVPLGFDARIERAQILGHHIQRLVPAGAVQPKLTLGPVGDRYEQEADRVAHQVVSGLPTVAPSAPGADPKTAQRALAPPSPELEEEETPRLKPATTTAGGTLTSEVEASIQRARSGGRGLDHNVRAPMEGAFGADFRGVRVHDDPAADTLNRSLQARAFTTGQDVFFRQGEYRPGTHAGRELLAHELTHVVQQNADLVEDPTYDE